MSKPVDPSGSPKSLPLILARELASNLATPMFLLDVRGLLVYFNEAAARLIGKEFTDLGEIPAGQFAEALQLSLPDGQPLGLRETPAGIAFSRGARRPDRSWLREYDGVRRQYEATAYPLFGAEGEMHGVFAVFWQDSPRAHTRADASASVGMPGIDRRPWSRHGQVRGEHVVRGGPLGQRAHAHPRRRDRYPTARSPDAEGPSGRAAHPAHPSPS